MAKVYDFFFVFDFIFYRYNLKEMAEMELSLFKKGGYIFLHMRHAEFIRDIMTKASTVIWGNRWRHDWLQQLFELMYC